MSAKVASTLQALADKAFFWESLASGAKRCIEVRGQKGSRPLKGSELRNLRFAGPTAIDDFIAYLNSGVVPEWQAPNPNDLADLGVHSPATGEFVHEVPYFRSDARIKEIELRSRPGGVTRLMGR